MGIIRDIFGRHNTPLFENGTDSPTRYKGRYSADAVDVGEEYCTGICAPTRGVCLTSRVHIPVNSSENSDFNDPSYAPEWESEGDPTFVPRPSFVGMLVNALPSFGESRETIET